MLIAPLLHTGVEPKKVMLHRDGSKDETYIDGHKTELPPPVEEAAQSEASEAPAPGLEEAPAQE